MGTKYSSEVADAVESKKLHIIAKDLKDLPVEALRALRDQDLRALVLCDNLISRISKPSLIPKYFPQLTKLDLSNNGLLELPEQLCRLPALSYFSLSFNKISKIPDSLPNNLTNLESLILYNNQLRDLPSNFTNLKHLAQCSLNGNYLDVSNLPEEMLMNLQGINDQHVPSRIIDNLYLGSYRSAENLEELQNLGITHILTVAGGLKPKFEDQFTYKMVQIDDIEVANIKQHFPELNEWIHHIISEEKGVVLVHCAAGVSRSASVVLAYLMWSRHWDYDTAYKHAWKRRPCISPNYGFENQLKTYDLELQNSPDHHEPQQTKKEKKKSKMKRRDPNQEE